VYIAFYNIVISAFHAETTIKIANWMWQPLISFFPIFCRYFQLPH